MTGRLRFTPPAGPCPCRACRLSRLVMAIMGGVVVGALVGLLVLAL